MDIVPSKILDVRYSMNAVGHKTKHFVNSLEIHEYRPTDVEGNNSQHKYGE
jgi:hypothetical protein